MPDGNNLIFVSMASYRDPQLTPTIADCLRKARFPERLRFGICWQHDRQHDRQQGSEEDTLSFGDDPRFRILDVDWRQSRGACWARAEVMRLWQGEDWFLQVDSHCRFAAGWDEILLRISAGTGSPKPILSTYATPFTPGGDEILLDTPMQMELQAFTPEGIPQLRPAEIPRSRNLQLDLQHGPHRPLRARFLSAGFLFAPGRFLEEVPYDPELYFLGEESSMTVRAFTHGYDLFHPAQTLVWHDYIRADARKHWGDHTEANQAQQPWNELDQKSQRKVQRLLLGKSVESFGLGLARSLAEYEAYAGLSFRMRKAQPYTLRGEEPPNPSPPADWPGENFLWIARIRVARAQLPAGSLDDPATWRVTIRDAKGIEIDRKELTSQELSTLAGEQEEIALICEFFAETIPASWTIQPRSQSQGWLCSISGNLPDEDYAILNEENNEQDTEELEP